MAKSYNEWIIHECTMATVELQNADFVKVHSVHVLSIVTLLSEVTSIA